VIDLFQTSHLQAIPLNVSMLQVEGVIQEILQEERWEKIFRE